MPCRRSGPFTISAKSSERTLAGLQNAPLRRCLAKGKGKPVLWRYAGRRRSRVRTAPPGTFPLSSGRDAETGVNPVVRGTYGCSTKKGRDDPSPLQRQALQSDDAEVVHNAAAAQTHERAGAGHTFTGGGGGGHGGPAFTAGVCRRWSGWSTLPRRRRERRGAGRS